MAKPETMDRIIKIINQYANGLTPEKHNGMERYIRKYIDCTINDEIELATAERDKRIERLNFALEKAIEQLYQYQSNYAIARGECIDNDNDIVTDWREEIWAIADGGSNGKI
jgi:hypothetical protein